MKRIITNGFISYMIKNNKEMTSYYSNDNDLVIQLCYLICNYNMYFGTDSSDVLLYFIEDEELGKDNKIWKKNMIDELFNETKEKYKNNGMIVERDGTKLIIRNISY